MAQANAKTAAKVAQGAKAQAATASTEPQSAETQSSKTQSAETQSPGQAQPAADAQRQQKIAERAYQKAEARGFAPGSEEQDWLEAEREVDGAQTSEARAPQQ